MSATVGSLSELGAALGIDGTTLEAYAAQDQIGGVDTGWYTGSLWSAEGKVLYALARALNVQRAVEFGTWRGCSASHIAQAIHDARRDEPGYLECVDVWESAGADIPDGLRPYIRMTFLDMCDYTAIAAEYGAQYELIFEDGPHDEGTVQFVWERARDLLMPGGVIISHDALHDTAGPHIRAGIEASGITPVYVSVGGSDCGLAVWRRD
jgi:predicted O-methyltransferase YrrM